MGFRFNSFHELSRGRCSQKTLSLFVLPKPIAQTPPSPSLFFIHSLSKHIDIFYQHPSPPSFISSTKKQSKRSLQSKQRKPLRRVGLRSTKAEQNIVSRVRLYHAATFPDFATRALGGIVVEIRFRVDVDGTTTERMASGRAFSPSIPPIIGLIISMPSMYLTVSLLLLVVILSPYPNLHPLASQNKTDRTNPRGSESKPTSSEKEGSNTI
jgi:hypothetical protein